MAKSGYLPDISGTFNFYRTYAVRALERKDYSGAIASLYNINSLLTEDYVIEIDSARYQQVIKENIEYRCNHCEKDTSVDKIVLEDRTMYGIDQLIFGNKRRMWVCPKCEKDVGFDNTIIIREKTEKPFYRKVVPDPPDRGIGIQRRYSFPQAFIKWFFNFLEELEHSLANYRIEYVAQNGHDMGEPAYKDKGGD